MTVRYGTGETTVYGYGRYGWMIRTDGSGSVGMEREFG